MRLCDIQSRHGSPRIGTPVRLEAVVGNDSIDTDESVLGLRPAAWAHDSSFALGTADPSLSNAAGLKKAPSWGLSVADA